MGIKKELTIFNQFKYVSFIFTISSSIGLVYLPWIIILFISSFKALNIIFISLLYIGFFRERLEELLYLNEEIWDYYIDNNKVDGKTFEE